MTLRSMTGYGRGEASARGIRVEVEVNSVNRKQFEVRLNLPRALISLESRMVELIQGSVSRGQVTGGVTVHAADSLKRKSFKIDTVLAAAYITELRRTAKTLKLNDTLSASLLLELPGVVTHSGAEEDADYVWPVLEKALKSAIRQLVAMRSREGAVLGEDLNRRVATLDSHLSTVRTLAPDVTTRYRETLVKRLGQAGLALDLHDPILVRELTVFADRSDITEEITRLESHLQQARGLMKSAEPAGRTLDFLAQEMFREINTIGSKANEVQITRQVIEFKTELERIREQVQNIE
ncbi:MAG: YicC/YloC family endoribonuclease [bacterium]